ncbi:MAG: S8 family peptidase, partial [Acidimicrobiales bacterium]
AAVSANGGATIDPALMREAVARPHARLTVIVREADPASDAAETLVAGLGGTVTHELPIVGGFSAEVPASSVPAFGASAAVARLWGDASLHMNSVDMSKFNSLPINTLWQPSINLPQARDALNAGPFLGQGVTVALLDTGVSAVPDLGNRVLARVDLTPDHDGIDRYGHGTHMAGLIAGSGAKSLGLYQGVAPKARLVSVKVASADGSTDVSVVLAGLEWVVEHEATYGIRVLNLSFGTDSTQSYSVDPLDYAVEQVWFSGIAVVVSAGNRGPSSGTINKPADDPYVISVGSADMKNTFDLGDDTVASFSSLGPTQDGIGKPDVVAPGMSLVSERAVGSTIDVNNPTARVGDYYFKGSGTSQSAAVVSGVLALMFQADPTLTPDVAKAIVVGGAQKYLASQPGAGAGLIDAFSAVKATLRQRYVSRPANQNLTPSTGLGSLEASRGSYHVYADLDGDGTPDLVTGEVDVLGAAWDGQSWTARSWSADAWDSSEWSAYTATTAGWSDTSWSGRSWTGTTWDGRSWTGTTWDGRSWSDAGWS